MGWPAIGFSTVRLRCEALHSYLATGLPSHGPSWQEYAKASIPAAGIVCELLRSRFARYINIGYFLVLAAAYADLTVENWAQPQVRLYGLAIVIPASLVAFADILLYRNRLDRLSPVSNR